MLIHFFCIIETRKKEQEEALNIALIVGGSVVILRLRLAYVILTEFYTDSETTYAS